MPDDDEVSTPQKSVVITFPREKSDQLKRRGEARNLGLTEISKAMGPQARGAKGRWCDTCKGIWYSFVHETHCPVCGQRSKR
ncbi:hypothetical protein [Phreatobacter oligotrophus]|jgi:hypothetical protein|uniref:Uncharacterized protein n=1 Tax=Phreatobacter oligotrophus TaxID=1122261 RepID=A0A2T4YWQ6_9HYPH|nr:hypothetical protein [Phreatobacter oligotrophus]PTM49293.1 hypothetical protein C8P69_1197 [Phreatobacter oligotrophus]